MKCINPKATSSAIIHESKTNILLKSWKEQTSVTMVHYLFIHYLKYVFPIYIFIGLTLSFRVNISTWLVPKSYFLDLHKLMYLLTYVSIYWIKYWLKNKYKIKHVYWKPLCGFSSESFAEHSFSMADSQFCLRNKFLLLYRQNTHNNPCLNAIKLWLCD